MLTLTSLATLPSLLPLTTLTVVLLTAEWSVDTPAARASIARTEALAPCRSIQFLEFPITPPYLHADGDTLTNILAGSEEGQKWNEDHLFLSITADLPFLPHLRVVTRQGDDDFTVVSYEDSFDSLSIARFIASLCGQPFPEIRSRDSIARSLRNGQKAAIIVDNEPFTGAWNLVFDTLSTRPGWVIGFADSAEQVFRERHRATPPAVVLADQLRGAYKTVSLHGSVGDGLRQAIQRFEDQVEMEGSAIKKRELVYFREPSVWRQYLYDTSPVGLDAWMGVDHGVVGEDIESFLWIFVTTPWCAFCQRCLPNFERFVRIVRKVPGVHAVIVDDTDALPRFLDGLVDGFPTVLMMREKGTWTGVQEYLGERSVRAMVDVHAGAVEREIRYVIQEEGGLDASDG